MSTLCPSVHSMEFSSRILYQQLTAPTVRFGRVPKREKAKILAAMQKVNQNSQEKHLNEQLEDESRLLASILQAHDETCNYTKEKMATVIEWARTQPVYSHCPPQMACPLNPMPQHLMDNGGGNRILEDFSERFSPAIRGVVEFAKRIPGFGMLSRDDQVTLLKAGVFEVLLVRLACMFDSETNSMICLNGIVLKRESLHSASNARFLLDSMFDFAERLNALRLTDNEIGLFCAVVVIAPDRPGLRNVDLVQRIHRKLDDLLLTTINSNHPENPALFSELKKKIPDLRTLNTLHSEKLLAYKMEPKNGQRPMSSGHGDSDVAPPSVCNYSSLLPVQWQQLTLSNGSHSRTVSPGQASPHGCSSDWGDSKDEQDGLYSSPRSVGSSVISIDESVHNKSPPRSASVSSAKSNGYENSCYSPSEQMAQFHIGRRPSKASATVVRPTSNIESSGSEVALLVASTEEAFYAGEPSVKSSSSAASGSVFSKIRRVDSPTDSGIESGKEQCNGSTPTTSICSSPRSAMDDKVKDVSDSEGSEKQESIDDMPMLKRALQAPPLINTNMLMDEAYRHHKKFRASKREGEPQSPSTTTVATSSSQMMHSLNDSLASSHSTLVKTLEQAPRYMNEQQLKRTDLIHNIIMRSEGVTNSTSSSTLTTTSNSSYHDWKNVHTDGGRTAQMAASQGGNVIHQNVCPVNGVITVPGGQSVISSGMKSVLVCPSVYCSSSNYEGNPCSLSTSLGLTTASQVSSMKSTTNVSSAGGSSHLSSQLTVTPRIMYTTNGTTEAQNISQHRRSPCLTVAASPQSLVIGSTPPPQVQPCSKVTSPHMSRSCTSSPNAAILIPQTDSSDSQPLNLSKKPSPPNSPPTDVKVES